MMKRFLLLPVVLFGLLVSTSANAIVIRFDEVFTDPPISSRTLVGDEWAAYGINTSGAYWYADSRDPFDGWGLSNSSSGTPGVISFLGVTNKVRIDWVTIASNDIFIDAYDAAGALLDSFSYSGSGTSSGTTTLSGLGIASLQFHDAGGTVGISTLKFGLSVPAPASLLLLGFGLVGLGWMRRMRLNG